MSFAQPIHRHSIATSSPSWLTTGIGGSGSGNSAGFGGYASPGASRSGSALGSAGSERNRQHEQELINAYEAEEERIINVLSRKLEQLREDKIELENALEAESESHVNKLFRELGTLRQANRELEARLADSEAAKSPSPSSTKPNMRNLTFNPNEPSMALMLEAMQRENESLRSRLVDTERNYVRLSRLNEVYREELIDHRGRLGLPLDNLIGLTPSDRDPFSHPTHHRPSRSSSLSSSPSASLGNAGGGGYYPPFHGFLGISGPANGSGHASLQHQSQLHSNASSPSTSVFAVHAPRGASSIASTSTHSRPISSTSHYTQTHGVPIPRTPSQIHRPSQPHESHNPTSTSSMPLDLSVPPSPSGSPYPLSPIYSASGASSSSESYANVGIAGRRYSGSTSVSGASVVNPASFVSVSTNMTSPPSSVSLGNGIGMAGMALNVTATYGVPQRGLTYPSVPPPSLSSSFGSPTVGLHMPLRGERDPSLSPVEPRSRRESNASMNGPGPSSRRSSHGAGERRVVESGSLRRGSSDRGVGMPIGGRVAESGSLVGRSRAGSLNFGTLPETVVEGDADDTENMELGLAEDIVEEGETLQEQDALPMRPIADGSSVISASRNYGGNDLDTEGTLSAKSR